jgi:hypothetical protein
VVVLLQHLELMLLEAMVVLVEQILEAEVVLTE